MNIILCDDDNLIINELKSFIKQYFTEHNYPEPYIYSYSNGAELLASDKSADIIFLDIEMPGINGIITGKELKRRNNNVIILILSSYMKYLDDAMDFGIIRYLSKPIDKIRLFDGLSRAITLANSYSSKILLETHNETLSIQANDIIYVKVLNKITIVHTIYGAYESLHNFDYWLKTLKSTHFFQCHRCFLVNMYFISSYDDTSIYLYNNTYTALIARRKKNDFQKAYSMFIENNM